MVVSNTSPILSLARIGKLNLLGQVYGSVLIPGAVRVELERARKLHLATPLTSLPWLSVAQVSDRGRVESLLEYLDRGEAEAIVLALEMQPEVLLMDERAGRQIATDLGLKCIGVLGTLATAKRLGLVPALRPLVDALVSVAGFWIDAALMNQVLRDVGE